MSAMLTLTNVHVSVRALARSLAACVEVQRAGCFKIYQRREERMKALFTIAAALLWIGDAFCQNASKPISPEWL